jgi:hypothetical protein
MRGALTAQQYQSELDLVRDTLARSSAAHWQEFLAAWDVAHGACAAASHVER